MSEHVEKSDGWNVLERQHSLDDFVSDSANAGERSVARRSLRRRFSVERSTEVQHRCKDEDRVGFYGEFGNERKRLDYDYHSHYRKERQWLHDSIIEDFLYVDEDHLPSDPWLIFTVGAQGAGKRNTVDNLVEKERLKLLSFVFVDPDEIRLLLPEYSSLVEDSPTLVDVLTQKESGYIAETLTLAALHAGRNVIVDGSLQDAAWHVAYIRRLKKEFPKLKVGLIEVTAELGTILDRGRRRSYVTGKTIPEEDIEQSLQQIPLSVEKVRPHVDYSCVIRNEDEDQELKGDDGWENFKSIFEQTSAPDKEKTSLITAMEKKNEVQKLLRQRSASRRRFSVFESSEENHKADHMIFYGKFAQIRETLDYSYHSNYTFERQMFQDRIINEYLNAAVVKDKNGEACTTPTEPWLVFTAGAMGAGKSYTMRKLVQKGRFPLLAFINVDPDDIRRHLPEFHLYADLRPELAGALTRKEAGYISEILTLAGLQTGKNVLVDGTLRDAEWYKEYFKRLRSEFPVLRLAIIHVTAPRDAVFQRASLRAMKTGRLVPRETLEAAMEQVPKSVAILSPLVDYHVEVHNAPDAEDIELVTEGETWDSFESRWVQTCAWVPDKKKMLRKTKAIEHKMSLETN